MRQSRTTPSITTPQFYFKPLQLLWRQRAPTQRTNIGGSFKPLLFRKRSQFVLFLFSAVAFWMCRVVLTSLVGFASNWSPVCLPLGSPSTSVFAKELKLRGRWFLRSFCILWRQMNLTRFTCCDVMWRQIVFSIYRVSVFFLGDVRHSDVTVFVAFYSHGSSSDIARSEWWNQVLSASWLVQTSWSPGNLKEIILLTCTWLLPWMGFPSPLEMYM